MYAHIKKISTVTWKSHKKVSLVEKKIKLKIWNKNQ